MSVSQFPSVVPMSANQKSAKSENKDSGFQGVVACSPDKPDGLNKAESHFWDEMSQKLESVGLLAEIDVTAFHRYVVAYCDWLEHDRCCKDEGFTVTFSTGAVQLAPQAILRSRAAAELEKLEKQFGITPRARQALRLENPDQGSLEL